MSIGRAAEQIWRGDDLATRATRIGLTPFSLLFSLASRCRGLLYDAGWLPAERVPLPVLSVGNLRVGGSGKTPMVLWLVERLRACGVRPVVAMRGYGASHGRSPTWLDTGKGESGLAATAATAFGFRAVGPEGAWGEPGVSDEALLVALRGEVPVAIAKDRVLSARAASAAGADVVVLDDGFQHRRLRRDLDIVLTRGSERDEKVLPAGPLREPWRALRRADVVLAPEEIANVGVALVGTARARPVGWVDRVAADAPLTTVESWRGREAVAVAGIARPDRFFEMLADCGVRVRQHRHFPDHHRYTAEDWSELRRLAQAGEWIATTEKDLVKLRALAPDDARLSALRVDMVVDREADVLRLVRAAISRLDAPQGGPHDR